MLKRDSRLERRLLGSLDRKQLHMQICSGIKISGCAVLGVRAGVGVNSDGTRVLCGLAMNVLNSAYHAAYIILKTEKTTGYILKVEFTVCTL